MKKFCYQLLTGCALILLTSIFLRRYQSVFPPSQGALFGVSIFRTLLLAGCGILAGLIMLLPDIMDLKNKKHMPRFQWTVFFGQGLPAMLMFLNQPIINWLVKNDFMKEVFTGIHGYNAAFSLMGSLWLGIILVNSFQTSGSMFHMKQRRRGR